MVITEERLVDHRAIQDFGDAAYQQYDHLLIGERHAKVGMVAGILLRTNIAIVGLPGGAKTRLLDNGHRIVKGIDDDRIAVVPAMEDMIPQQVVGGQIITIVDGLEKITTVKGLIKPDAQKIQLDEGNRDSFAVQNALLPVLESGYVDNGAGERIWFNDLEYVVTTINPDELDRLTNPMSAAATSRHAIGVILGSQKFEVNEPVVSGILLHNFVPQPDKMEAQTTLDGLHRMRHYISESISLPRESLGGKAVEWALKTQKVLREEQGISEAVGRMTVQMRDLSRTLAALDGENSITEGNLRKAIHYIVGARVGLLGAHSKYHTQKKDDPLNDAVDDTVAKILED